MTDMTDEQASYENEAIDPGPLQLMDLPGFLIGLRSSMQRVMAAKGSLGLGAVLVATAALAREYDAVSLVHHPLDLIAPFAASLFISAIIFGAVRLFLLIAAVKHSCNAWEDYRLFLSGYWMTAPLAWLYAVPIETMTDEISALRFNLTMLSIVSIWRVVLFARFVSLRYQIGWIAALSWILVPCMTITLVALFQKLMSMISIMGGLRLTQTQQILMDFQSAVFGIAFYGILPAVLLAFGFAIAHRKDRNRAPIRCFRSTALCRSVWTVPAIAAIVLAAASILFQPDQFRAAQIDRMLVAGRFDDAIAEMQACGEHGYPIMWDPPPTFTNRRRQAPPMSDLLDAIDRNRPDRWVIDRLLVQADELLMWQFGWTQGVGDEAYLESSLCLTAPESLVQLQSHFQKLSRLPADTDERDRRSRLLKIVTDSIPKAEAFAAEVSVTGAAESPTDSDGS